MAGETDAVLQNGALNDAADVPTGNTIISGSYFFADGTNGALIFVRISSVGAPAGKITQLEVQALAAGVAKTIHTFAGLALNAAGLYVFQVQPAASASGFDASIQGTMPNQGQLKLTLTNKDDAISASVMIQSTW